MQILIISMLAIFSCSQQTKKQQVQEPHYSEAAQSKFSHIEYSNQASNEIDQDVQDFSRYNNDSNDKRRQEAIDYYRKLRRQRILRMNRNRRRAYQYRPVPYSTRPQRPAKKIPPPVKKIQPKIVKVDEREFQIRVDQYATYYCMKNRKSVSDCEDFKETVMSSCSQFESEYDRRRLNCIQRKLR